MQRPQPVTLEGRHVRLLPLRAEHEAALRAAAADGELWRLRVTSVPEPEQTAAYIAAALAGQRDGTMLPFAVQERSTGQIVGSTR
ncbi:MAG: GNAT family N-acetyltransferase, partial [Sutterellaceae bacterium]|nr:GNAT family N-acetyltransferase [Burkholderiaceae bacterium]MDW8429152.1 GNAT family N-acetyltransferase [Sutterellaceae bacterium]